MYILSDLVWGILISFNLLALTVPGLAVLFYDWVKNKKKTTHQTLKIHRIRKKHYKHATA